MSKNRTLLLLFFPLWFWACNQVPTNPNKVLWGTTEYYSDFLFKKYEPVIMSKSIELEFNEDAQRLIKSTIELEVVEKNEHDRFINVDGINIYKNGVECNGNVLIIEPNEKSFDLGIEFTEKAPEGNHTLYLRVKNSGGLDRIDNVDLSSTDELILAHEWVVKKDDVINPLGLLIFWIIIIILFVLLLSFIISRIVNPIVKFSSVYIDYNDNSGERRIRMGRSCFLLCTNQDTKYSIFYKLFVGLVKVEVNDFWVQPLKIKSGRRDSIVITGLSSYNIDTEDPIRRETISIINEIGGRVTITTT